jgi:hypothetical protein
MPLTDNVSLAKVEPRYANCTPRAGGGADCYCSGRDSSFDFQLADPPDDATCESASLNCDDDAVITATGVASCQPTSMTAFVDSCEADLACTQSATVDDREIVGEGRMLLSCARFEQGSPWRCSCASGPSSARFSLAATDLTAWQACDQAPAACLEELPVFLGPHGSEVLLPPDPLSVP